jgi:hypothetical protein
MPLAEKLDKIRAAGAKRIPENKRVVMEAANKDLFESNIMDGVVRWATVCRVSPCPMGLTKPSNHPNCSPPDP